MIAALGTRSRRRRETPICYAYNDGNFANRPKYAQPGEGFRVPSPHRPKSAAPEFDHLIRSSLENGMKNFDELIKILRRHAAAIGPREAPEAGRVPVSGCREKAAREARSP